VHFVVLLLLVVQAAKVEGFMEREAGALVLHLGKMVECVLLMVVDGEHVQRHRHPVSIVVINQTWIESRALHT